MLLKNKTAVITGCNRGIGKAILQEFAKNGAEIFACARKESAEFTSLIQATAAETGAQIHPIYFDFKNEAEIKEASAAIIATKKKVDILVNNAGVAAGGLFQMTQPKDLKEVFEINFFSQMQFTQSLARYMARFKSGSIINIGSTAGLIGNVGTFSYGSSKAALMYATKTMATELGTANVRVNSIAPGITKTEMFDQMDEKARIKQIEGSALKRAAEASEIANVALFLASDLSTYVTGQILRVDGGLTT
jgi:3-oxoacyl-[acyl-carrier protein] reductase